MDERQGHDAPSSSAIPPHGQPVAGVPELQPAPLTPEAVRAGLTTRCYGRGEIGYAPEMDSTNTQLKRAAQAAALPAGSLALCDRQTQGRGRMQRAWEDPDAGQSLTCSLLLRPKLEPRQLALVTLATAVAAAETLAALGFDAGIKWPNDIVISRRKCVGILCELVTDPAGETCVVVGTGFNVNQRAFAQSIAHKATSLWLEGGREIDRCTLLCQYLEQLERAMEALEARGLAGILPGYEARSVTLGQRVQVVGTAETFVGIARRVDENGALWVQDDQGALRRVLSADVSVRGVMGYV